MSEAEADRRRMAQTNAMRVLGDGMWRPTRQVATEGRIGPRTTLAALQSLECAGRVERRLASLDGKIRRVWRAVPMSVRGRGLVCGVCKRPGADVCHDCWVTGGGATPAGAAAGGGAS